MADQVRIERIDDIAVVRMDRPPANALDLSLVRELDSALELLETQGGGGDGGGGGGARGVVLTGVGNFFSAGLDLKVVPEYTDELQRDMIVAFGRMIGRLYAHPHPTVAAVNGHAVAAGTLLALACDYRIGPIGDCRLGLTGARVGIPYPVAAQAVIEAELDPATRRVMVLGAEQIGPDEAMEKGILDELLPADRVLERAVEVAQQRSTLPAEAYGKIKQQLRAEALRKIRAATELGEDPCLDDWVTHEATEAAARVLRRPGAPRASPGQQ